MNVVWFDVVWYSENDEFVASMSQWMLSQIFVRLSVFNLIWFCLTTAKIVVITRQ